MVADEGREPAHALATLIDGPDVRRGGSLDPDLGWVTPGLGGSVTHDVDHPLDEVDVGELEDDAVGGAAGHAQHHRAVAGDPDGQLVARRPGQVQLGVHVGRGAALDEVLDDAHGVVEDARL